MAGILTEHYLNLLKTGEYSDFTIACKDAEFKVHRVIVCLASKVLRAACNGLFAEAEDGKITFEEEDADIMSRIIAFLYTNDYDDATVPSFCPPPAKQHSEDSQLSENKPQSGLLDQMKVNTLVYKCADMLDIPNLKALASKRFQQQLKDAHALEGFESALEIMFQSTHSHDVGLRLAVTRLCLQNHAWIKDRPKVIDVLMNYERNVWTVFSQMGHTVEGKYERRYKELKSSCRMLIRHESTITRGKCSHGSFVSRVIGTSSSTSPYESIKFDYDCSQHESFTLRIPTSAE